MSPSKTLVSLLLAQLEEIVLNDPPPEVVEALRTYAAKLGLARSEQPAVGSSLPLDDELRTVSVKTAAEAIGMCEESARRLCRAGILTIVRKGRGRNYDVLWSSVLAYKRHNVVGNGVSKVEQEAQTLASQVARNGKPAA